MPQVAMEARFRFPALAGAAAASLTALALLALSGHAHALGESVEAFPRDVFEGGQFHADLTVPSLGEPTGVQAHVTCPACGAGWTTAPLQSWRQLAPGQWRKDIDFPGALFPGSAASQPTWAGNYTVRIVGAEAFANVTVHATDAWRQPNSTFEVTQPVRFVVAGVPPGGSVFVNLSKWSRTGALNPVVNLRFNGAGGLADGEWRIPREHAADMGCAAGGKCRTYSALITVPGVRTERVEFQAIPARLETTIHYLITDPLGEPLLPLGPGPLSFNRTENVSILVDVKYHNGARVGAEERTQAGNASLNGTLRLSVERVTVATQPNGNQTVTYLDRVQLLYAKATPQGWRASWNIPRNLTATTPGPENPQYRVRVLGQEDRFANRVPDTNGTAFRVYPLRLEPQLVGVPAAQVERLTNATAIYNIRYADRSPWTNATNETAMRAWLVDEEGDQLQQASISYLDAGTWKVTFQPGLKFRDLGFYRLRIEQNTDRDDNVLPQTDTELFEVVAAKPRVELLTKVRGQVRNETEGFARSEKVDVQVVVRYADGSAYNASRLPPEFGALAMNVSKVDARGQEVGFELLGLQPMDDLGRWGADLKLDDLDDDDPLGPWQLRVRIEDVEDPPNVNETSFTRVVRGAPLGVEVTRPPEPLVRASDPVMVRFQARYPGNALLTEATAGGGLAVQVRPWKEGVAGEPVARLWPTWMQERLDWGAVWHTNRTTIVGDYVLTVEGRDVFGNVLDVLTTRTVTVFVDEVQRQVLREPPANVTRGESVLVIFDGAEGDFGEEGFAGPRIELQKWNPLRSAWEKERTDVRVNGSEHGLDHVGRIDTDGATNLGQYRLALFARNDQHALVTAYTRSFRVLPVEVERAWLPDALTTVAQPVAKGSALTLPLERRDGDLVQNVALFRDGERIANGTSLFKSGRFDVQLRTSFTLPDGAYMVSVRGRDIHNNSFLSPALWLNLSGVELLAKIPAPPAAAIQRAEPLELRALLQYPDQTHAKTGDFTARFLRDGVLVDEVALQLNRSAWLLRWLPPADAPLGRYAVQLWGDDALGNKAEGEEVFSFQLAEGVLKRAFTLQRTIANRTENIVWVLPASEQDASMAFVLRDETGARRALNHTLSKTGDYIVQWRAAKDERLTRYVLEAQGEDTGHNAILAESRTLTLKAASLGVAWLDQPGRLLKPGEQGRWEFQVLYADGTPVPAKKETPPIVGLVGLNAKLIENPGPQTTPSREGDRWVVTWTPVAGRHSGIVYLAVAGKDAYGNEMRTVYPSSNTLIDEGALKQFLGVPGVEAALVPVALLGAALLARRRPGP